MKIKGNGLQIGYGDSIVIDEIDIEICKNEITTIIGPNGSGKSTVLKAITRLLNYRKGIVNIDGRDLKSFGAKEFSRRIGVLPQIHTAPADFMVKELVSYGRMPYQHFLSGHTAEDDRIIKEAMEATGTYHLRDKSIHELSGGESQRVWIATVLSQQPEILFLDEPTTYLDISHQIETMRMVKKLNRTTGMGVVMVLHDLSHALEVSDRIIVIKDGKKYSEGTPTEVITQQMLRDVYHVDADIVHLEGRSKPLIAFRELA